MNIITIELPLTVEVGGPGNNKKAFNTGAWTGAFILENALHGLKQRRTDKLSVTKDPAKLAELDARIGKGEDLSTGERGSTLTDEDEAIRRMWNKGKVVKEQIKVGDFEKTLLTRAREAVVESLYADGLTGQQIKENTARIAELAKENLEAVRTAILEDAETQKQLVAVKIDREKAVAPAPKIKISGLMLKAH